MPKSTGQLPLYYNHLNTGRPERQWFSKFRSNFLDVDNDLIGAGRCEATFCHLPLMLGVAWGVRRECFVEGANSGGARV